MDAGVSDYISARGRCVPVHRWRQPALAAERTRTSFAIAAGPAVFRRLGRTGGCACKPDPCVGRTCVCRSHARARTADGRRGTSAGRFPPNGGDDVGAARADAPDGRCVAANEIHVPVGEPVKVELDSLDVIHSFWVPSLAGKRDLIPGRPSDLTLIGSARTALAGGQVRPRSAGAGVACHPPE